jgi:hypothetical protein
MCTAKIFNLNGRQSTKSCGVIGAVLAYRNEREDTHSPSIDTVSVGHGADQHSQLSMTILLQRSHTTETIIGIEREKDSRERERTV